MDFRRVLKRAQFSLDLFWATMIHKSQGLSLGRAVIDLGQKENPLGGLTYVALSRLRTMQGLYIKLMTWPRLESINKKVIIKQRLNEEQRLKRI